MVKLYLILFFLPSFIIVWPILNCSILIRKKVTMGMLCIQCTIKHVCPYSYPGTQNHKVMYLVVLYYEYPLILYVFEQDMTTNNDFRAEKFCLK
jgi:hypothetical protein